MPGTYKGSMEVISVDAVTGSEIYFRVIAVTKESTLVIVTPWPPKVGDFLIVTAENPT